MNGSQPSPATTGGQAGTTARYLILLAVLWAASQLLLGILQYTGTGMGFKVWPMGEDRVWLTMMQNSSGTGLAKMFWTINDRNPLSPWWYMVVKKPLAHDLAALYLVRRFIDLFLCLAVFLLIHRLGRHRHPLFALSCALVCLLWNFSEYREQIMWNFLGALGLSVLSIWAYCTYLDSQRREGRYLALSLVLYLAAIGTYTLQASACLAVPALALLRTSGDPTAASRRSRWVNALVDASYYVAVFAMLLMVWVTTARPSSDYYRLEPSLIPKQVLSSLKHALWHPSYTVLVKEVGAYWSVRNIALILGASGTLFAFLLWVAGRKEKERSSNDPSLRATLVATLVVVLAISASTLLVESMSTVWFPGHRSLMIQQVFQPLLYCSLLFGVSLLLRRFGERWVRALQVGSVALLGGCALLGGLEYNRVLNDLTAKDRQFLRCLRAALPAVATPTNLIVRLDSGASLAHWRMAAHNYAQSHYAHSGANLQFLEPGEPITDWSGYNTMLFGPEEMGVKMLTTSRGIAWAPYSEIVFVAYDGHKVTLLPRLTPEDLAGYRVGILPGASLQSRYPVFAAAVAEAPK
jgi:hypothetical protein